MNKYLILGIVVILIAAGGWWYLNQSNAPTSTSEPSTLQQQNANTPKSSAPKNDSAIQPSTEESSKTYSTHPLIKAYLQGPIEVMANTIWRGSIVIPQNTIGVAGAPNVMWGDGSADPEIGGSPWQYDNTGSAAITHTYTKPGNYSITIYINGGAGVGFEQGTVTIKKVITVR